MDSSPIAPRPPLPLDAELPFFELDALAADAELREAVAACVARMKQAALGRVAAAGRHPAAEREVAPEALAALLERGVDVHGIAEDRHISNVIVFNSRRYPDGIFDESAGLLRRRVDALVAARVDRIFISPRRARVECAESGFLLYPPGSYMGWHTNAKKPGWRLMLTWAEGPGQSFFRYRDPRDGSLVTAADSGFNVRLLNIRAHPPLWHAVYSDAFRYTLGYFINVVERRSLARRVAGRLRRFFH